MSDCNKVRRLLGLYLDDKLNQSETAEITAHLSSCTACKKKLEALKSFPELLKTFAPEMVPSGLRRQISGKIRQASQPVIIDPENIPPPPWHLRPVFLIPGVLFMTLCAVIIIIGVFRPDALQEASIQMVSVLQDWQTSNAGLPYVTTTTNPRNNLNVAKNLKDLPQPEFAITNKSYKGDQIEMAAIQESVISFSRECRIKEAGLYQQDIVDALAGLAAQNGLPKATFRECIQKAIATNNNPALPSYVEQAMVDNKLAWIIILNWDSGPPTTPLSKTGVYAISPASGSVIRSWPPEKYAIPTGNPHRSLSCMACHPNFDTNGNKFTVQDWKQTAKLACISCKTHKEQYEVYKAGIHGSLALSKRKGWDGKKQIDPPTCADCHSGHTTLAFAQKPRSRQAMRNEAHQVCGVCHQTFWNSYSDYYHGSGYKVKSPDAPACWDCHGTHNILPSKNPSSNVNPNRLNVTCKKCHPGSDKNFVKYGKLVHGYKDTRSSNALIQAIRRAFGKIRQVTGLDK